VSTRLTVGIIATVAFLIRLLHVFSYDPIPISDMAVFVEMAVNRLTFAHLFDKSGFCPYPPGYALFIKPFYLLLDPETARRGIQIAQAALGAWTCVLIHRLATLLHSRRAGIVAALLACFYPHYLFYTSSFMSETLFIAAYDAALLLLLRAGLKPGARRAYGAGVATGIAALVRPAGLSLLPAAIWAAWGSAPDRRGRLRALGLIVAGGLTVVGPWTIRNGIAYGRFVLIAPNGAANFAIGNTADSTGAYVSLPSVEGDAWERESVWRRRALDFIERDPWGALFTTLRSKWRAFWEGAPPWPLYSSNPRLFYGEHFFPMATWRIVFCLGLIGLIPAMRKRRLWIVPVATLTYVAFHLAFFGQARFRLPIEGHFIALAGAAVVACAGSALPRRRVSAAAWGAMATIVLVAILVESSVSAAGARAFLREPESLVRSGGQVPVPPNAREIVFFGEDLVPIERSRGRYLRFSFLAYRQGPERANPTLGEIHLDFFGGNGEMVEGEEYRTFVLEAIPEGRWAPVSLKTSIPPAAVSCRLTLHPKPGIPDVVILDRPVLRYARGNDVALEFLFPYLLHGE
jgi:4-amino-4-deoxy-L-arabinose transferase-like glycosyltransferase